MINDLPIPKRSGTESDLIPHFIMDTITDAPFTNMDLL